MNTTTKRRPAPVRTHTVVGDRDQVRAALQRAHDTGRLIAIHEASALPDRRVQVVADLADPVRAKRWYATRTPWLIAGGIVATAAAVGVVWLIVLGVLALIAFIGSVIAWIGSHLLLIGAIAVALLLLMSGGAACAGLHCGGCRG